MSKAKLIRRLGTFVAVAGCGLGLLAPAAAQAAFGFSSTDLYLEEEGGAPAVLAGSHPYAITTAFSLNTTAKEGHEYPDGSLKDLEVELPVGMAGIPAAVPQCSGSDFATLDEEIEPGTAAVPPSCPDDSGIGYVTLAGQFLPFPVGGIKSTGVPLYNLAPAPGTVAKFGFIFLRVPVTIEVKLSEEAPYRVVAIERHTPQPLLLYGSKVTVWGDPSAAVHDPYRGACLKGIEADGTFVSRGSCPYEGTTKAAFLTLPRACTGPLASDFFADPWEEPEDRVHAESPTHDQEGHPRGFEGCEELGFAPSIAASASSEEAESPAGLDFTASFAPDEGLTDPAKRANSDLRKIVAKLPVGVTLNPSAAQGLTGCTTAQYEAERLTTAPGAGCPAAAKIGTLTATSPLVDEPLEGAIFAAAPDENPFGSFLSIYLVLRNQNLGVIVKQAGEVTADPKNGQLTATFTEAPQLPISTISTEFRAGPRAPLATPSNCGKYSAEALETSWAGREATTTADFEVSAGPGGSPCPGPQGSLAPGFAAGTADSAAGSYSPLDVHLTRRDGEADLTRLSMTLPQGLTGKLAGIGLCPEAAIAAASDPARSGRAELASPSCPASSQIGHVQVGAGVGPSLTYVAGTIYLAGPYLGAPYSVVVDTPAVAGPYDLGNVVVREPLRIDPYSARVSVDGAAAAPLPRILKGIPVRLRDLRISIDRPGFTLNATSCEPKQIEGQAAGAGPSLTSGTETFASLAARYQASDCGALGFKPKLALSLSGATRRSGHPALKALVSYPKQGSYANIARAQVGLPHSEFLDQGNIREVCTQPQLASNTCPPGSVYGHAKAWTPLLDEPLEGPVYLGVGYGHELPDLVADLNGRVRVLLHGRVDTTKRHGLRNTFEVVPDAPVSKFELSMKGGRKGLLENSENICLRPQRASARFVAQNGRVVQLRPRIANGCGRKHHGHRRG